MSTYWSNRTRRELDRRTVLRRMGLGAIGVGGLSLVGCARDNDSGLPAATNAPSQSTPGPAQPKKGGTFNQFVGQDIPSIDPFVSTAAASKTIANMVYSRLFQFALSKRNENGAPSERKLEGDAAESIQDSGDGLTYIVKLRPNVKFHPPVDRVLDAEDVVFSWKRFTGKLADGKPFPGSDRLAFIQNIAAPDTRTVVITLNQPYALLQEALADSTLLQIMPRETGTAFDPAQRMVGSGPWRFDEYVPSSFLRLARNPEWHFGPDRPYLDKYQFNIVKEAATQLNQFLGGNLDTKGINGIEASEVKTAIPAVQLRLTQSELYGVIGFKEVTRPRANAPWTDIRVRQALSMAIDRDTILDVTYNLDRFKDIGISVPKTWVGVLPPSFGDLAISPKGDPELEPLYKYDPNGAKSLLNQAGGSFDGGDVHYHGILAEGVTIVQQIARYWAKIGVNVNLALDDYASVHIPRTYRGTYEGMGVITGIAGQSEPSAAIAFNNFSTAQNNFGRVNDPEIDSAIAEYRSEADPARRREQIIELQRYLLKKMYYLPSQWGAVAGVTAYQPAIRGVDVITVGYGSTSQVSSQLWRE